MSKNPKHIPLRTRKANFYEKRAERHFGKDVVEKEKPTKTLAEVLAKYRQKAIGV